MHPCVAEHYRASDWWDPCVQGRSHGPSPTPIPTPTPARLGSRPGVAAVASTPPPPAPPSGRPRSPALPRVGPRRRPPRPWVPPLRLCPRSPLRPMDLVVSRGRPSSLQGPVVMLLCGRRPSYPPPLGPLVLFLRYRCRRRSRSLLSLLRRRQTRHLRPLFRLRLVTESSR
jgi:hypothetical protein